MSKKIDIVYFYEFAVRELDVACAVKCIAREKYGLRIEILRWPREGLTHLVRSVPKVVVLPFCYNSWNYYKLLMEWRRAIFFNLAWEQFFCSGNLKQKIPRDPFARGHVIHHAWSGTYVDFLLENGVPRGNIFLNGNPACALYMPPYRNYFDARTRAALGEAHGLDCKKRWIFFAENYNWAFRENLVEYADPDNQEDIRQMVSYCRESLRKTILWCEEAARRGPIEIIIRPRHNMKSVNFRSFVSEVAPSLPPNIHIIQEGTVREWIMASDITVSSYSTTLIEAAVADKPAFMLEPMSMPASLHVKWHDLTPKIRTASEFHELCCQDGMETDKSLKKWACDVMLSEGDCIVRLAQLLDELCRKDSREYAIPRKDIISMPKRSRIPWWFLYAFERVNYMSLRNRIEKNRSKKMFNRYIANQQEIDDRVENWKKVLCV